jgi:hypothetical protein
MHRFDSLRWTGRIMRRIAHWAISATLIAAVPIPVVAASMSMQASDVSMRQPVLTDCEPCAVCYMAPLSIASYTGSGDQPALVLHTWTPSPDQLAGLPEALWSDADVPACALRILFCRWLN